MNLNSIQRSLKPQLTKIERQFKESLFNNGGIARIFSAQLTRFKGKRLRPIMLLLAAQATGKIKPAHLDLAVIIELIHNATLVHDDVLDEATIRRNIKTINDRWGNESSILFGDFLLSNAFLTCLQVKSEKAMQILSRTTFKMCHGELTHSGKKFDLSLREPEYLDIIQEKTASLFSAATQLGAMFACNNSNGSPSYQREVNRLAQYGLYFGMAYQIMDDYFDIVCQDKDTGKTTWADINKGKVTLPVISLTRSLPAKKRSYLKRIIFSNGRPANRQKIIRLLNKHNALSYSLEKAKNYVRKAKETLSPLKNSSAKESLKRLAEEIVPR
ncbi:MAG: polyprenyl synthetase family protein, partial [Planctomycetes bacterium]|nr:polyprenyl synthetase family protein [Planctomycetota bacterium]